MWNTERSPGAQRGGRPGGAPLVRAELQGRSRLKRFLSKFWVTVALLAQTPCGQREPLFIYVLVAGGRLVLQAPRGGGLSGWAARTCPSAHLPAASTCPSAHLAVRPTGQRGLRRPLGSHACFFPWEAPPPTPAGGALQAALSHSLADQRPRRSSELHPCCFRRSQL